MLGNFPHGGPGVARIQTGSVSARQIAIGGAYFCNARANRVPVSNGHGRSPHPLSVGELRLPNLGKGVRRRSIAKPKEPPTAPGRERQGACPRYAAAACVSI